MTVDACLESHPLLWSIKELTQHLADLPDDQLTVHTVVGCLGRLHPQDPEIELLATFSRQQYTRNRYFRNHSFEVLIMCWEPGQETPIHDHNQSFTVEKIYAGRLCGTNYRQHPDSHRLEVTEVEWYETGTVFSSERSDIHRLANPTADTPAISIHVYAPPLLHLTCFDEASASAWLVNVSE